MIFLKLKSQDFPLKSTTTFPHDPGGSPLHAEDRLADQQVRQVPQLPPDHGPGESGRHEASFSSHEDLV